MGDRNNQFLTILVVEDLDDQAEYLTYLLKRRGFNVVVAKNAEKALNQLNTLDIDCALVDINLGEGMDGFELMYEIRDQIKYRNLPIISVTAYCSREIENDIIEKGFTDLMVKPYSYDQLYNALDKHLYPNNQYMMRGD
ncbi:response regulator [Candidatus Neomarinimicrobiota bacterium]